MLTETSLTVSFVSWIKSREINGMLLVRNERHKEFCWGIHTLSVYLEELGVDN